MGTLGLRAYSVYSWQRFSPLDSNHDEKSQGNFKNYSKQRTDVLLFVVINYPPSAVY